MAVPYAQAVPAAPARDPMYRRGIVTVTYWRRGGREPYDVSVRQPSALYKRHRFPGEVISHAVWLY